MIIRDLIWVIAECFPYFLQFKSKLATVRSQSCYCWLYRGSPSLTAKDIISLISVLTIWWCPYVKSSLVLLEEGVYYDQCVFLANLCLPFPCFILYSKAKICPLLQVSLDFYFCNHSLMMKRTSFFLVLVQIVLLVYIEPFNICFFSISVWGIDLDYFDIEWFALEMNWDHSIIFEIAPKYCILDSFIDYEGYSISSKGFLPTLVDIIVTSSKSPILVHFSSLIPEMLMFTLVISCLTTSNLPWFRDLAFQVPMQYYSLQHWTFLSP